MDIPYTAQAAPKVFTPRQTPIIMQTSSVIATEEKRKTNTRRVITPQPDADATDVFYWWRGDMPREQCADSGCYFWCLAGLRFIPCPYGEPGDLLWVKEPWRPRTWSDDGTGTIEYGDGATRFVEGGKDWPFSRMFPDRLKNPDAWRSPMFMPRFASRLTLKIEEIKVERVQEISEADALAEGVERLFTAAELRKVVGIVGIYSERHGYKNYLWHGLVGREITHKQTASWIHQFSNYDTAAGSFASLWERINGPRGHSWWKNEFVWAIRYSISQIKYKSSWGQP